MVGPNYKEPLKPVVTHWYEADASVKEASFKTRLWWRVFQDPVLTALINQGYQSNLSLQSTGVRVLRARAQLAQSVGQLYPQQQALGGNYNYNRIGGTSLQGVLPPTFDTATFGMNANWELDFWGKYRRAIQANDAIFLASLAAYDSALVTLTADIAITYVQIRTIEQKIKITQENIAVQSLGVRLAKARFSAGQTSLEDVAQAQTELSKTQALLPGLRAQLQRQKDALSVLLGTVPNSLDPLLNKGHRIPVAPAKVAVGIPKEALARRPDVYQARMQAIAQSENIGAVKANLFPSFSLTGTFVFASNNINGSSVSDLFEWSNRNIVAGPAFTWPILNYGQITNAVRAQDAVFQESVLNYIELVLKAQQEVQDNISAYIESKKAASYLTQADSSATQSLKLALVRYKEGEVDFTPVLNAEQQQLSVQLSLADAQGDIPRSLIALYRALGGGWELRGCNDIVPAYLKREMAARTNWGTLMEEPNHRAPQTKAQELQQLYQPKW
jgi:NodT family efflux transporter outer membrane factor (OMF) lipoprotein